MKRCLFVLLAGLMLLLSACAAAQVSYRLGDDFSITVDYVLELQPGGADAAQYANAISQYWSDMGFVVGLDDTDGALALRGSKHHVYESPGDAAQAFSALLDDSKALLQDAQFTYTPSFDYDQYGLSAAVSLEGLIRQSEVQNIPEGEIDALEAQAADGTYTLCIALPGDVISTNADSTQDGVCMWTLGYGETRRISLETSKLNQENRDYYAALQEQRQRDDMLLLWCGVAGGVLVAALIVVTILRNRKNRPLKVRVKKF